MVAFPTRYIGIKRIDSTKVNKLENIFFIE